MDKTTPEKAMKELTIMLMYLSRFNEKGRFDTEMDMAWKGYDFNNIKDWE